MKIIYGHTERIFEKLTSTITSILGNPISFILALIMVIFWWSDDSFKSQGTHQGIGDIIF